MSKKFKIILSMLAIISIVSIINFSYAREDGIILNKPLTDDVNHTFKYPNLIIDSSVKPYSLTLSIEDGYFSTNDATLNDSISTYYDFKGGTNISNAFIGTLNETEKYKVISFNLKNTVDLSDNIVKQNVISAVQEFTRNILFYNNTNKDAKFTLTFSELEMKLYTGGSTSGLDVVAYQSPGDTKEHYYVKITGNVNWDQAYNIAAGLKWNNLQGYLLTITSESEHNFIYNSLGSIEGWIGAAAIKNFDSITYNTQNIVWDPATDKIQPSYRYKSGTPAYDDDIEFYWRWVAGPEAGKKVFDGYTHFNASGSNEPNNSLGNEWCAEYGFGNGGAWNDYPNSTTGIKGYYLEFGGFDDDDPTIKPVSLTSTFKWKDYDYRNITERIKKKLDELGLTGDEDIDEIKRIIEEAIEESGLNNVTYTIKDKKFINNVLTYDIEIIIDGETFNYSYIKDFNPNTYDGVLLSFILLVISLTGIIITAKKINLNKN